MERSIQKNGLINLLLLLVLGVGALAVARYANSLAGQVAVLFQALGVLVAAASWFQMRLEDRARLEKLEVEELARTRSGSALFESKEAELFPAQRAQEQFERFFVPFFTGLLCLAEGAGVFFMWRWLSQATTSTVLKEPMVGMSLFGVFALVLLLSGIFSATMARLENQRLLRPSASFLLLGAYLSFAVAVGIALAWFGAARGKTDMYVARALCVLLGLISVETLVTLLFEHYRPRVKGKIVRPLYESRLVGLLAEPQGLIRTAGQALDYQFGFKVSETGFYRFLESWLGWLLLGQAAIFVLSTGVVFIEAGEQGLLERFGRHVQGRSPLGPGAHLKWPWPIDQVYRFPTEQVQSFMVGIANESATERSPVAVWTTAHGKEDNFVVANRSQTQAGPSAPEAGKGPPPVGLITVSVPVQYQVTNAVDWYYNNEDAPSLLQDLAYREIVRYLAGADLSDLMSQGRLEAAELVRTRLQSAADEHKMGARISFVGLQDIHPPLKVAPDYEKVVSARHIKEAAILAAKAYDIQTNALAQAQATNILNKAAAEGVSRVIDAAARAALFTNQIPAYEAAPAVYAQRAYLQTFASAIAPARKYVVLTTNTQDVIQFDLEDKIRGDLLKDLYVPPAKTNK